MDVEVMGDQSRKFLRNNLLVWETTDLHIYKIGKLRNLDQPNLTD